MLFHSLEFEPYYFFPGCTCTKTDCGRLAISFCLQNVNDGKGGFSESVNTTLASQASTSAPVPAVTLIHHDGNQVSTVKQIVSMEGLKEILHKHEKVKLDDPQVALQEQIL